MNSFKRVYLVIAMFAPLLISGWIGAKRNADFNVFCAQHVERAARSNSIDAARDEIGMAISWLEEKKMVEGYSGVVYQSPSNDIGYWYKNLKEVHARLGGTSGKEVKHEISLGGSQMNLVESSIVLERVQTSLLDKEGTLRVPTFISLYPNQKGIFWTMMAGWASAIAGFVMLALWTSKS